ncbi:hypothetical protein [Micromonospora chalcea]|uniref:hypothetical protein n=1 Tax=Micromonospora chalcea TaxID=1874 RepID=UPI003D756739
MAEKLSHGLYYVVEDGGAPIRLDGGEPPNLTEHQVEILRALLELAEHNVRKPTEEWGNRNNLAVALYDTAKDLLPRGVYYVRFNQLSTLLRQTEVCLISGPNFPWTVQGDEKPVALKLVEFARRAIT